MEKIATYSPLSPEENPELEPTRDGVLNRLAYPESVWNTSRGIYSSAAPLASPSDTTPPLVATLLPLNSVDPK